MALKTYSTPPQYLILWIPLAERPVESSELHKDLAELEQQGEWETLLQRTRALATSSTSSDKDRSLILYLCGKALIGLDRFSEARQPLQNSLLLNPAQFHAHYLLGYAFAQDRLWLDALWCQRRCSGLQPDFADAWYEQGRAAHELDDNIIAIRCLQQAIRLRPDWLTARHIQQSALVRESLKHNSQETANLIRQFIHEEGAPEWLARQWYELAGAYFLAGDLDRSRIICKSLASSTAKEDAQSIAFPQRIASVTMLLIDLCHLDQEKLDGESHSLLRSYLWLPACQAEIDLWFSILEPALRIVLQRLPKPTPDHCYPYLDTLKLLPFAVHSEVDRFFNIQDNKQGSPTSLSPSIHRLLRDNFWDPADITSVPQVMNACRNHLRRAPRDGYIRRRLDQYLHSLSEMMLDRPARLVSMPGQDDEALSLRMRLLDELIDADEKFCELDEQEHTPRHSTKLNRFLLVANGDLPQCVLYRVKQKAWHLQRIGCSVQTIWREDLQDWQFTRALLWADAIIICRYPAIHTVIRLINAAKRFGCHIFYDIDDLLFDNQFCPPDFESYGGTLSPVVHRRFKLDVPIFDAAMKMSDALIVSTSTLRRRWKEIHPDWGKPIFVIPNMAPQELLASTTQPREPRRHGPIRIAFASGTTAHKMAWRDELAPALLYILQANPSAQLDLIGTVEVPDILAPVCSRIRCKPFSEYATYLQHLGRADIGVVVLEPGVYTDAKSAIRWMEFSYLGVPMIVSPTATYKELLKHNEDVLFARGSHEWISCLQRLIDDPSLRYSLANHAHIKARHAFGLEQADKQWSNILDNYKIDQRTKKKKLLVINVFFAPQSVGGATRVAQDQVLQILEAAGDRYEVTVLCADEHPWQGDEACGSSLPISVDCHAWKGARVVRLTLPGRPWNYHFDGSVEHFCRQWFKDESFDLIHAHSIQVISAAPLKVAHEMGIPYVVTLHDGWWLSPELFLTTPAGRSIDPSDPLDHHDNVDLVHQERIQADLDRRHDLFKLLELAAERLAVSESFARVYNSAGISNVNVLENDWTPMNHVERGRRSSTDPVRFCFVGGMSLHKGYAVIQAAIHKAKLSNYGNGAKLTVVDSRLKKEETYELEWNGTRVVFIPSIPMHSMAEFYSQQDVLLAPSIWPESYGLVTREALSAGLWVVASDIGALAEPIEHGINGDVISPRDSDALANVLIRLCKTSPRPELIGLVESKKACTTARALLSIYDSLL